MAGFTKNDSGRIGFVTSCLFAQALDVEEMKQWATNMLAGSEESPPYMVDLLEFNSPLADIFQIIGFVPHWPYSEDAELALYGLAFKRGREPYDCPLDRGTALKKLEQHPEVESTFCAEFPFIAYK